MKKTPTVIFILLLSFLKVLNAQTEAFNNAVKDVTEVIIHDVFTPPAACRIYAYSSIAAYYALQPGDPSMPKIENKLNAFSGSINRDLNKNLDYGLSSIFAFYFTARSFVFSEERITEKLVEFKSSLNGIPDTTISASENYAHKIASAIIKWSSTDNYKESRSWPRYELLKIAGSWEPTAPDYADAVEPYWGKIRPCIIDSANRLPLPGPGKYNTDSNSIFYKESIDVYNIVNTLTEEQKLIARFWDDNPFTTYYVGHMQYAHKKISPSGHWMDITRVAIEMTNADIYKSVKAYCLVSIAMNDGFILCWNEKYKFSSIRPETFINKFIDESWKPFIQTPPFPEYPSGHSTISAAAATVLSELFGNNFSFTDSIETEFELPARYFTSFNQAAEEASISRFYGGIHFKRAIDHGSMQGKEAAKIILTKMKE